MSKPKTDTQAPAPTGEILVIWRGYADDDKAVPCIASKLISGPGYKLDGLVLLAGASLVSAALFKAHEDAGSPGLVESLDEIVKFTDHVEPIHKMPLHELLGVIGLTRDGRVLRAWHAAELAKAQPRRPVLDALAMRLKSWSEFGPAHVPSIAALPKRAKPTKPQPIEATA